MTYLMTPYDLRDTDPFQGAILLAQLPAEVRLLGDGYLGLWSHPTMPFTAVRGRALRMYHTSVAVIEGTPITQGFGGVELLPVEPPLCRLTPGTEYLFREDATYRNITLIPPELPGFISTDNGLHFTIPEFEAALKDLTIRPDRERSSLGKNVLFPVTDYPYLHQSFFQDADLMQNVVDYYKSRYNQPVILPPACLLATLAAQASPNNQVITPIDIPLT